VLAYQWNPYGTDYNSATTDASLLIPKTSLDTPYIVAAWDGTVAGNDEPRNHTQVTVVFTEDDTELTVIPSSPIPADGSIGPFEAGVESAPMTYDALDVLTLRADDGGADLTGTVLQADKQIAVFGGHSCGNVPNEPGLVCCCDHLEEQILPLAAWGTEAVMARYLPRPDCSYEEDAPYWRVIAGADGMTVTFDPPAPDPVGASHTFAEQGELLEFQSPLSHYAAGTTDADDEPASFFAYQLMIGGALIGGTFDPCGIPLPPDYELQTNGDPMMLTAAPAGQYLDRYVFNTDSDFDFVFDSIIVVRQAGTEVELDCAGVIAESEFQPIGSSEWEVAYQYIDDPDDTLPACEDGVHLISADEPIGLSVVGTFNYNSYGYLGGVGVRPINPDPVIE